MIPTQDHPGQYWRSADAADIWLNEAGAEAPKVVTCQTPQGGQAITKVDELELLGAGLFGAGRPCLDGSAKWTGDAYRYGVYMGHKPYSGPAIIILQHSGAGIGWAPARLHNQRGHLEASGSDDQSRDPLESVP